MLFYRWRQRFYQLCREEHGQGLVEFAVVLPILLLLTVGTVMLTLSYMQKARLNGLAFSSARVAAVRRPGFDAATWTLKDDQSRSKQSWLSDVQVGEQTSNGDMARVQLRKTGQRLDVLANLISGQPGQRPQDLVAQMQLPSEFKPTGEPRPQTFSEVDYTTQNRSGLPWLDLIDALPDAILDSEQMADPMGGGLGDRDRILSLAPPNARLRSFYKDRGWDEADFRSNSEKEQGQLATLKLMGDNFKAIELGGNVAQLALKFLPLAGEITELLGEVGAEVAAATERTMVEVHNQVDDNVRGSFGGTP